MIRLILIAFTAMVLGVACPPVTAETLVPLARPGPWSGISSLIGYGDRLWFTNSVAGTNHNAADIYSYDPSTGATRFEHTLFSQDSGDPAVHDGLLYWPFEDPRFSMGFGEVMATNGSDWRWTVLPHALVLHVHAMTGLGEALYVGTGAWNAGLQRSADGGETWQALYDRPTPEGRVSRLTVLEPFAGTLYGGLTDRRVEGVRLLRLNGERMEAVPNWPIGQRIEDLEAHGGWLYAVNIDTSGSALWRTDGDRIDRVNALDGHAVRALASDRRSLWAITMVAGGGSLWRSSDGLVWSVEHRFEGAVPLDVAVHGGRVYVGTEGPDGIGTLWGPAAPAPTESAPAPTEPPTGRAFAEHKLKAQPSNIGSLLGDLDRRLGDPASYADYGRGLREALAPLARHRHPSIGEALAARLDGPFPDLRIQLWSENLVVTARDMARWGLLWCMAQTGGGRVPPSLLLEPWDAIPNNSEKYFEVAPAAAWAVSVLDQNDPETLAALIARLDRSDDPAWLRGDITGALSALTGKPFGRDAERWRAWWRKHHPGFD